MNLQADTGAHEDLMCSEWQYNGGPDAVEEQRGQALRGGGGLYDLLLRHPRLQLLPAQEGLSHLQKEVPLGVFGELTSELKSKRMQEGGL